MVIKRNNMKEKNADLDRWITFFYNVKSSCRFPVDKKDGGLDSVWLFAAEHTDSPLFSLSIAMLLEK